MEWKIRYEGAKEKLLCNKDICTENRDLFREFFDFEEYKLKRMNRIARLDEACYKTLVTYVYRFKNANRWFKNKPWKELTKDDIKRVYDGLEDGLIKTRIGEPVKDTVSYYNKIFRSKPFKLAGKQ